MCSVEPMNAWMRPDAESCEDSDGKGEAGGRSQKVQRFDARSAQPCSAALALVGSFSPPRHATSPRYSPDRPLQHQKTLPAPSSRARARLDLGHGRGAHERASAVVPQPSRSPRTRRPRHVRLQALRVPHVHVSHRRATQHRKTPPRRHHPNRRSGAPRRHLRRQAVTAHAGPPVVVPSRARRRRRRACHHHHHEIHHLALLLLSPRIPASSPLLERYHLHHSALLHLPLTACASDR